MASGDLENKPFDISAPFSSVPVPGWLSSPLEPGLNLSGKRSFVMRGERPDFSGYLQWATDDSTTVAPPGYMGPALVSPHICFEFVS